MVSNIPGIEVKVKLNSAEVASSEWQERFEKTIKSLITELVDDKFEFSANITEHNTFSISISGIPNPIRKSYRINVDVGLFRMIYDGLYVVLSNNSIFSGLGSSYGRFQIPTLEVPDWNSLDLAIANNGEDVLFDLDRASLHEYLFQLCLSIILRHEIRHIANGHIGYLTNQLQPLFFEHSKNGLDAIDSQTLEMDVDSCVFVGILDGLLRDERHQNQVPSLLRNETGYFMSALFCIQFLFYCMPSRKVSSIAEIENSSHPNAYLRYFFCFTAGLSYLKDINPEFVEIFGKLHQDNFFRFVHNIAAWTNADNIKRDHDWSMSEEGFAYLNKIWNNWDKWIDRLQPFAYLKLAPPNMDIEQ